MNDSVETGEEQARKESAAGGLKPQSASSMASAAAQGVVPRTGGNGSVTTSTSVSIGAKPTLIDVPPMHFLIMDAPRQGNLHVYIREMRKHHVMDVVRVCEPTYRGSELDNAGITLHEMEYKDGTSPPKELIMAWLQLVERTFYGPTTTSSSNSTPASTATPAAAVAADPQQPSSNGSNNGNAACIAVHCVAGLGRAPVMVAIALIEFANMDPVEAVSTIRARRRGAINEKQLLYLEGYKKQYKKGSGAVDTTCSCVIS